MLSGLSDFLPKFQTRKSQRRVRGEKEEEKKESSLIQRHARANMHARTG
jgi:hypothetical protein